MNSKRSYSMAVRSEQADQTRQRIIDIARKVFVDDSDEFTLERIASESEVSVRTVLRIFGSKAALILNAIGTFRPTERPFLVDAARPVHQLVTRLFDDYEEIGDRVVRMLAEEHRIAGFAEVAATGRAMHRGWVEASFAAHLMAPAGGDRDAAIVALVAATDVYLWKLLRRDLGLDRAAAEAAIEALVVGALAVSNTEGPKS